MEIDRELVQEIRDLAERGATASEILVVIEQRMGTVRTSFRLFAIVHFQEAFQLSFVDAMRVGAADVFPGGAMTSAELDAQMHLLLKTRVRE
jgi:hypothetical protein